MHLHTNEHMYLYTHEHTHTHKKIKAFTGKLLPINLITEKPVPHRLWGASQIQTVAGRGYRSSLQDYQDGSLCVGLSRTVLVHRRRLTNASIVTPRFCSFT